MKILLSALIVYNSLQIVQRSTFPVYEISVPISRGRYRDIRGHQCTRWSAVYGLLFQNALLFLDIRIHSAFADNLALAIH